MLLEKRYNLALILLGLMVFTGAFMFKYSTGSYLTISEEAYEEVTKYEIQKRKNSISRQTIEKNIFDIDTLYQDYLRVLDNPKPCISKIKDQLISLDKVELIFVFNYLLMDNIELYTVDVSNEKITREVHIAAKYNCEIKPNLSFEKKDGAFKLKEVLYYEEFLICVCDSIEINQYLQLL